MPPAVAAECVRLGKDAIHLRDVAPTNSSDDEVMRVANQLGRIVVSRDTDFGTLLSRSGAVAPSIILIRRPGVNRPAEQAQLICDVLDSHAQDLARGAIVVIDRGQIRVRPLPLVGRPQSHKP